MPSPCARPTRGLITAPMGSRRTTAGTRCAPRALENGAEAHLTCWASAARGCTASARCAAAAPSRRSSATLPRQRASDHSSSCPHRAAPDQRARASRGAHQSRDHEGAALKPRTGRPCCPVRHLAAQPRHATPRAEGLPPPCTRRGPEDDNPLN